MGGVNRTLAIDLRDRLALGRAVETGTYRGITARMLASLFDNVITIELSESLHRRAQEGLRDLPRVQALRGHSVEVLGAIASRDVPTLYFLDGHWSAGTTDGASDQCPVLNEIAAIGAGHPDDCIIIDDARLFTAAPPPPYDRDQWPTVTEVFDAIRLQRAEHVVTLLGDQVIAVPQRAKPAIDAYSERMQDTLLAHCQAMGASARGLAIVTLASLRTRVDRRSRSRP